MMMHLQIITPVKVVFEDEVNEVIVPTPSGYIGILPQHVSLVTRVSEGELTIKKQGKSEFLAVTGGFLQVAHNTITILADYAVRSEEIEVAKAEEAKKRAEKLMEEHLSERDFAQVEAELRKSLLELKVAQRRRTRSHPSSSSR